MEMIQVVIKGEGTFSLVKGESVLSVLLEKKLMDFSNCGGNGTCGRCAVRFIKGAPLPLPADRKAFDPSKLREGYRLACRAKPLQDCILELHFVQSSDFILTQSVMLPEPKESPEIKKADKGIVDMASQVADKFGDVMVIADLGTTTIVMQLVEVSGGNIIDTYQVMNPQRQFGADVISRVQQSLEGKRVLLAERVQRCMEMGLEKWKRAGFAPRLLVIAGNTVMTHLYMGYDVTGLSRIPFLPVTLSRIQTQCCGIETILMPGISPFVGGDIVAGIMACEQQMQKENKKLALLLDLGTNGEMAIIGPDKIVCTATAAGPAFEGGATALVPGSDMIAIVAKLLSNGVIDETGLICEQFFHKGVTVDGVSIRQEDVRGLQIAKAAVFAGIRMLLREYGIEAEQIERIYLAGGFGYKLDVQNACRIGLLPRALQSRTVAVGNSALAGAYLYGKSCLQQPEMDPAVHIKSRALPVNLAEEPGFNDLYMENINLLER